MNREQALDAANKLLDAGAHPSMRSCWTRNQAHEHLKSPDAGVFLCFACGHWFYAGHDITDHPVEVEPAGARVGKNRSSGRPKKARR